MADSNLATLTVGGGCFWCTEAIFLHLKGVEKVVSGYSGGTVPGTPTYREVSSGRTGHAEVVQIEYAPGILTHEEILFVFMTSHDPTTLNQQGADFGSQYRSVIFYHTLEQKEIAEEMIKQLAPYFERPITTELKAADKFYPAENHHQDYFARNGEAAYCKAVIVPKLTKLKKMHGNKFKDRN